MTRLNIQAGCFFGQNIVYCQQVQYGTGYPKVIWLGAVILTGYRQRQYDRF